MSSKHQFWDYVVTFEIKISAANREEAKQMIITELNNLPTLQKETVTIIRVRPVIKK